MIAGVMAKRVLISGGPGSGCSSTGVALGRILGIPVFDSDFFYHKPSDPPFQEPFTPEERRTGVVSALAPEDSWILSGSVATWGVPGLEPTHGVFLDIPSDERLARLERRQRASFGSRIDSGGDMEAEHRAFLDWAARYEEREETGRCRRIDRAFLEAVCPRILTISGPLEFETVVNRIVDFVGTGRREKT